MYDNLAEFCIKSRIDYVNSELSGKTIKRLFDADFTRVFVEFTDGSVGMIEMMDTSGGESFLSVLPPNREGEKFFLRT